MPPTSPPKTNLYFVIRGPVNPKEVKAGGFQQVLNYAQHWHKHKIQLHVSLPAFDGEPTGEQETNGVWWHRYRKGSELGPASRGHDESLQFALKVIETSNLRSGEAPLLMPTDIMPVSAQLLHKASTKGIASVMPIHMFPEPIRRFSIRDRFRLYRERRWFRSVTAMHANSVVSGQAMSARAGKPLSWAKVILTGVDLARFRPPDGPEEKTALRDKLGLPNDKPVVLFVGGATQRKGVDFLVDSWMEAVRTKSWKAALVLVGGDANRPGVANADRSGYESFAARFYSQLEQARQHADVRLLEHTPTVQECYRAADLFVFPSLQEGLPNAVLEAMASGLPVVSTRFLGFPHEGGEFGFDGHHFLSLPREVNQWASELPALAADSERCAQMGAAARRWVECNQDIHQVTAQSAEFFHGLAHRHLLPPPSKQQPGDKGVRQKVPWDSHVLQFQPHSLRASEHV